jgi:hypothetical protein
METQPNSAYLTGKEGGEFDVELSASWTQNYRHKHPGETESHFFGKEILQKILDQEGCVGIRIYHAHDKPLNGWKRSMASLSKFLVSVVGNVDGEKHLIIVGTTKEGKEMLPKNDKKGNPVLHKSLSSTELKTVTTPDLNTRYGIVGQIATPCPGSANCP